MSRILEVIRRVVRQEMMAQRNPLLGIVTAIFPHEADDDDNNYEINVRLKHEDLELRKVPLAVGHVGVAVPPRVGDLVLVQFVNGDMNQPVVSGRFYHADERPPLHHEDEVLFEQRLPDDTLNHLRFANDGTIYIQREVKNPENNSEATAGIKIDPGGIIEIKTWDNTSIILSHDGNIEIKAAGNQIDVTCDTMTVNGNLVVTDGSTSTTISGNTVTGG